MPTCLSIDRFDGEARIDMVAPGYEQALGARVIAIEDTPLAQAQELAATLTLEWILQQR